MLAFFGHRSLSQMLSSGLVHKFMFAHLQAERKKEKAEAARQANIERIFAEGEGGGDDME